MRSNWSRVAVLVVSGCMSVVACGDDDDSSSNTGGTSGSKNEAGEGGSSSAGKTNTGGKGGKASTGGSSAGESVGGEAGNGNGAGIAGMGPEGGMGGVGGAAGGAGGIDGGGAGGEAPEPQSYCAPGADFGSGGEGGGFGDSCYVQKNYGDICTPFSGVLRGDTGSLDWFGELESGGNVDELRLQLTTNYGPFGDTLTTGTFELTGDELNYGTCGVCVLLFEDSEGSTSRGTYFATGGTVKVTQLEPRLVATITNLTLEHVTIDSNTYESTPVGDSCTTKFSKVEIDTPVPAK